MSAARPPRSFIWPAAVGKTVYPMVVETWSGVVAPDLPPRRSPQADAAEHRGGGQKRAGDEVSHASLSVDLGTPCLDAGHPATIRCNFDRCA